MTCHNILFESEQTRVLAGDPFSEDLHHRLFLISACPILIRFFPRGRGISELVNHGREEDDHMMEGWLIGSISFLYRDKAHFDVEIIDKRAGKKGLLLDYKHINPFI